ncbi:hypothetical protein RYD26_02040 [Pasteurellaceae bacterium LIM206]|nr:hypothetical protein [Pasteurellaceae bacterium LIM206]
MKKCGVEKRRFENTDFIHNHVGYAVGKTNIQKSGFYNTAL